MSSSGARRQYSKGMIMKSFKFPVAIAFALISSATHAAMTGKEVYTEVCSLCHGTIMSVAPTIGNRDAWASRIKQGDDVLVQHALHGYRQMPARGGMSTLTDGEVRDAVQYMVSHSQ